MGSCPQVSVPGSFLPSDRKRSKAVSREAVVPLGYNSAAARRRPEHRRTERENCREPLRTCPTWHRYSALITLTWSLV
eukprot:6966765-Pyramimonas_sp.AAC.1